MLAEEEKEKNFKERTDGQRCGDRRHRMLVVEFEEPGGPWVEVWLYIPNNNISVQINNWNEV